MLYARHLHSPFKFPPVASRIFLQTVLSQQPIQAQPNRSQFRLQVCRITAPAEFVQLLPASHNPSSHRIQVHVITRRAQIARRAPIDQLRLVTSAKEMTPVPMPPIESLRVGAQKPTSFPATDSAATSRSPDENDCSS